MNVADVHQQYQDVEHHVELFDALLAKIIIDPSAFEVVLVLNEYGDFPFSKDQSNCGPYSPPMPNFSKYQRLVSSGSWAT